MKVLVSGEWATMTITEFPRHPFTQDMARCLGISRRRIASGLAEHLIQRVFRGVYVRTDVELSMTGRASAAALVISPHGVVCDRTAAWIWGVDCFQYRELDVVPRLETLTLRGHRATREPHLRGCERDLWPDDYVVVDGVHVTTPIRTALDLGCSLSRRDALAAIDALMRKHGFSMADLVSRLPRYFRRRGVLQLRDLVRLVDPRAESPGESWTRLEMHDHGLPKPEVNWWVVVDGVPTFRLDLAYPHAKVAVEYDGEEFHSRSADKEADSDRRRWLEHRGWTVIVIDKTKFTDAAIAEWIGEIRTALAAAQTPPRRRYVRS